MFEMTEYDAAFTKALVIQKTGEAVGVEDAEFKSPTEIRQEIEDLDGETAKLLTEFLVAFDNWFKVTNAAIQTGQPASSGASVEITEASNKKDQCRQRLLQRISIVKRKK